MKPSPFHLEARDLGRMRYGPALEAQREVNQAVIDDQAHPTLLLVEHEPVITISRRRNASDHLVADQQQLRQLGIEVASTDRGGDITYHGPGQLVAYPILPLRPLDLNLRLYMRLLERIVIDTLDPFAVAAFRVPEATGVWVRPPTRDDSTTPGPPAKICALGVRVRRNVTMHGLALNVSTDLAHFDTIVPCGLADRSVISMKRLLGKHTPPMDAVKRTLVHVMRETLNPLAAERASP